MAAKRKHVATGKTPPGGKRVGAGRPLGATNALPLGVVAAIRAARLRLPSDATPEAAELAGYALQRIVDVMDEKVSSFSANHVLTAARHVREELCGPVTKKHEVTGPNGAALTVSLSIARAQPRAEEKPAAEGAVLPEGWQE